MEESYRKWKEAIEYLSSFKEHYDVLDESWDFLKLSLKNRDKSAFDFIENFFQKLQHIQLSDSLIIKVDGADIEFEDFKNDFSNISYDEWSLLINKNRLRFREIKTVNFFALSNNLSKWLLDANCLDKNGELNRYPNIHLLVFDFEGKIEMTDLIISSFNNKDDIKPLFDSSLNFIPDNKTVAENIHILSNENIIINPKRFLITKLTDKNVISEVVLRMSSKVLLSSLADEYHSEKFIILNGIKKINLCICNESDWSSLSIDFYKKLCSLSNWIYEERISTRKKLFAERFTLECELKVSLLENLKKSLDDSLKQAKARYNFVILDRKDQYAKELNALLKDVKGQSDLYSGKIRTLLNNLLRDTLAGFILVGFTLFTRVADIAKLAENKFLKYIFTALGIYYLISAIFQLAVDAVDVFVSRKEMFYWENVTKELIPKGEFETHVKSSLRGRLNSIYVLYPILILIYVVIALFCFYFVNHWKNFLQ